MHSAVDRNGHKTFRTNQDVKGETASRRRRRPWHPDLFGTSGGRCDRRLSL